MKNHISIFHVVVMMLLVIFNSYSLPLLVTLVGNIVVLVISGTIFVNVKRIKNSAVFVVLAFLSLYTLVICLGAQSISTYTLSKPLRMIAIYIIFAIVARKMCYYSTKEILLGVFGGLFVHLLCVYLQFLKPDTKQIFFRFLEAESEKESITEYSLRAFGLCSSFDSAGLCLCVLMVLVWIYYKQTNNILLFALSIIVLVSCFLVGRTAMIIGSVFFAMMLFSLFKKKKRYFFVSLVVFSIAFYYLWGISKGILDNNTIETSYRSESVGHLTEDMLFLPDSLFETFFGSGESPGDSDVGYVKIIHMIGFLGLAMVLYLYWITIRDLRPLKKTEKNFHTFMLLFFVLLLLFNFKLLLLYARGINDLYFLLYFVCYRKIKLQLSY